MKKIKKLSTMKKFFALLLSVLMCFCFAGCDGFEGVKHVPGLCNPVQCITAWCKLRKNTAVNSCILKELDFVRFLPMKSKSS